MVRVAPLLVWPLALLGTAAAFTLSASGLLSLVAAHATVPPPARVKMTMPAPRLVAAPPVVTRAVTPAPQRPVAVAPVQYPVVRTPAARIGPNGAVLRGAAGEGAVTVWRLQPGTAVTIIASRAGWTQIDQQGLVGWVPTSALITP